MFADEDHEERGDQVVDPLNVSAGRVAYGPYKQYPLKNLQGNGTRAEVRAGSSETANAFFYLK